MEIHCLREYCLVMQRIAGSFCINLKQHLSAWTLKPWCLKLLKQGWWFSSWRNPWFLVKVELRAIWDTENPLMYSCIIAEVTCRCFTWFVVLAFGFLKSSSQINGWFSLHLLGGEVRVHIFIIFPSYPASHQDFFFFIISEKVKWWEAGDADNLTTPMKSVRLWASAGNTVALQGWPCSIWLDCIKDK